MIRFLLLLCTMFPYLLCSITPVQRSASAPYISGDGFRAYADFVIDFKKYGDGCPLEEIDKHGNPFDPQQVQAGNVIFVNNEHLGYFFSTYHNQISQPYILLTHNGDYDIPGNYAQYLDDPKLIAWFGDMVIQTHPKLHPIPVGIANNYWPHGNPAIANHVQSALSKITKNKLLYLNIGVHTNPKVRTAVVNFFAHKKFCSSSAHKNWEHYLYDLASSKFVLSPRGNGIDCHRTWEALLMGSFPIVQRSALDSMFENLPVLIIDEWQQITEDFLENKYKEMSSKQYDYQKLFLNYWLNQINAIKSYY